MKFLEGHKPPGDLTYDDLFLVPRRSSVSSRLDTDVTPPDGSGLKTPIVVANMTAVAGRRLGETVARRGGVAIIPQDLSLDVIATKVGQIRSADVRFDTPITIRTEDMVGTANQLILNRSHGIAVVVDEEGVPIGVYKETDGSNSDPFRRVGEVMTKDVVIVNEKLSPADMLNELEANHIDAAPVVNENNKLLGVITKKDALRLGLFAPALGRDGRLLTSAAIGINGDPARRALQLYDMGVDIMVVDTAHGHQEKTLAAIEAVRNVLPEVVIVAGNVVTKDGVQDLAGAGANIIKVGVGPGAMCTTRMKTGVGRPQFSAVLETAEKAAELGVHVWADGGIKHPRDLCLAIAAGASAIMAGSIFAPTLESSAPVKRDSNGRLFKENFGMASGRAVAGRNNGDTYQQRLRQMFEEGISGSTLFIDPLRPSAQDLLDEYITGLMSSMTYAGATNIREFQERAVIGIQNTTGFSEGAPRPTNS